MQNIVKVIENSYDNPYALHGLLKYIFTDKSSEDGRMCRFCGSYCTNIYSAEAEMMAVKNYFLKNDGRGARHFVVSLGSSSLFFPAEANTLAQKVCCYYGKEYQIVYAVHENTKNLHIHFVMNTVSYIDGHKFSESPYEFQQFKNYVQSMINEKEREVRKMEIRFGIF